MNQDYYSRQQVIEIFGFDERFLDELEEEELFFPGSSTARRSASLPSIRSIVFGLSTISCQSST